MTDRVTVYADAIPLETDLLRAGQYAMVGDAKLAEAMLGTATVVSGFTLTPTAPASLAAVLGPGQVYQQENLEASPWSSMPADTHTIVKQGLLLDAVNLTFTPPTTVGYAQAFLVEVQYSEADTNPVVYPYFNASNPDVQYNGPDNSGSAQSSTRKGVVAYQIKAGVAATAGTQASPTPDPGWAGLFVVTLAQGATSITQGNIAPYAFAPFLPATLPQVPAAVQSGKWTYAEDSGTADNYVVTLTPNAGAPIKGQRIFVKFANSNMTTSPVINFNGAGNQLLLRKDGTAPAVGDVPVGWQEVFCDGTAIRFASVAKSDYSLIINATTINQISAALESNIKTTVFSAAQNTNMSNGAATSLVFTDASTADFTNNGAGVFTCQTPGAYNISISSTISTNLSQSGSNDVFVRIYVNGQSAAFNKSPYYAAGAATYDEYVLANLTAGILRLNVGDQIVFGGGVTVPSGFNSAVAKGFVAVFTRLF